MTHRPIGELIARNWLLIVIVACLGGALAFGASLQVTPTYTASTQLYVTGTGATPDARFESGEYVRTRMSTYAGLISSPAVLDVVRRNLNLPRDTVSVADSVVAVNPIDTFFIDVTVKDTSREQAMQVADQIGAVANAVIADLESPKLTDSPASVTVVKPAVAPLQADGVQRMYVALGLLAGAAAGVGLARIRDNRALRRVASNGHAHGHRNGALVTGRMLAGTDIGRSRP